MRYQAIYINALLVTLAGLAAAIWGWTGSGGFDGNSPGRASALVAGLIAAVFGLVVWRSAAATWRRVTRLRGGRGLGGRWFAGPEAMAAFLESEKRRGVSNAWRPSRRERKRGVEVLWGGETLVVGGCYLRIASGQYPGIEAAGLDPGPPMAATVRYRQLWFSRPSSTSRMVSTLREFRFPVADAASARAMASRFAGNLAGRPEGDRRRAGWFFRGGLVLAGLFAVAGLTGLGIGLQDGMAGAARPDGERALLIAMTVIGAIGTPAALAIALLARSVGRDR